MALFDTMPKTLLTNMEFNTFTEHVQKHRLPSADQAYVTLGMVGELGELFGYLAKAIRDNYSPDMEHVKKELGDILWFVSAMADDIGSSLNEIAEKNVAKITERAAAGKLQGSGEELHERQ